MTNLTYDDLIKFLTKDDYKQIEEMPEPDLHQATRVIKTWRYNFGGYKIETSENLLSAKVWVKLYVKVKQTHPELLI